MSVLINMEMPEKQTTLTIFPNGYVAIYDAKDSFIGETKAFPVPKHGRLIEDVAVREQIDEWLDSVGDVVVGRGRSYYGELLGCIKDAPTIIAAEEGE